MSGEAEIKTGRERYMVVLRALTDGQATVISEGETFEHQATAEYIVMNMMTRAEVLRWADRVKPSSKRVDCALIDRETRLTLKIGVRVTL